MKNKKITKLIIIIAVILIPFIYSFFYLKAFWDPYSNLKDMKIAIVNEDEGDNGENLGNELVTKLIEEDIVSIEKLNKDEAKNGLIDQKYYATISIPENFTKDINSAKEKDKTVAAITYSPNQKSNYLASQIISKIVTKMESNLKSEITENLVSNLSNSLEEVPGNLQVISDNVAKLSNGTAELLSGTKQLNGGTSEIEFNYLKFDKGIKDLASGMSKLSNGINTFSQNIETLDKGTTLLSEKTKNLPVLTNNISTISDSSTAINSSISNYVDLNNQTLDVIINSLDAIIDNPSSDISSIDVANSLKQQIQNSKLTYIGTAIKQKEDSLNGGILQLKNSTNELYKITEATSQISSSTTLLNSATKELQNGSYDINSGLDKVSDSSTKIKDGITNINSGANSLTKGTNELYSGVNTFKTAIDTSIDETKTSLEPLNGIETFASNPVNIEEDDYAKVESYGIGFTPYFVSLSLWVGSLILLIVLYYDPSNRFKLLGKGSNNKIKRTVAYFGLATLQAVILGFLLKSLLNINVTNILLYYFSFILTANVFLAIIHFFIMEFDDVGKFLSILMLVFQLAASGGTFPIETVPSFFQKIYHLMPMNYTIKLIKESIILENSNIVIKNSLILLSILAGFIILTVISEFIKREMLRNISIKNKIENKVTS